jgi:hypothetical protein
MDKVHIQQYQVITEEGEMIIHTITTPPVSHFLEVVAYYPQTEQRPVPISYIKRSLALPVPA